MTQLPPLVFPGDCGLLMPGYRPVLVHALYMDNHGTWLRVEDESTNQKSVVLAIRVIPMPEDDADAAPVDLSDLEVEAEDYRIYGGSFPRSEP